MQCKDDWAYFNNLRGKSGKFGGLCVIFTDLMKRFRKFGGDWEIRGKFLEKTGFPQNSGEHPKFGGQWWLWAKQGPIGCYEYIEYYRNITDNINSHSIGTCDLPCKFSDKLAMIEARHPGLNRT